MQGLLLNALIDRHLFGNWTYAMFALAYWPLWTLLWCVHCSEKLPQEQPEVQEKSERNADDKKDEPDISVPEEGSSKQETPPQSETVENKKEL